MPVYKIDATVAMEIILEELRKVMEIDGDTIAMQLQEAWDLSANYESATDEIVFVTEGDAHKQLPGFLSKHLTKETV